MKPNLLALSALLALALNSAGCTSLPWRKSSTVTPAPEPTPNQESLVRQLQVYRAAIEDSKISSHTLAVNWTMDLPLDIPTQWIQGAPTLQGGYRTAQSGAMYLPREFPLTLVGSEDVPFTRTEFREDWDKLASAHSGVDGVISFTPVGFSQDAHEAILGYRYFHAVKPDCFREDMAWIRLRWGGGLPLVASPSLGAPQPPATPMVFDRHWVVSHRVDTGRTVHWTPKTTPTPISPARAAKATPANASL